MWVTNTALFTIPAAKSRDDPSMCTTLTVLTTMTYFGSQNDSTLAVKTTQHGSIITIAPHLSHLVCQARSGQGIYLTPAKRKRKTKDGKETAHRAQGRCRSCEIKSTVVCSACLQEGVPENQAHYCPPGTKHKECFANHMQLEHLGEGEARCI